MPDLPELDQASPAWREWRQAAKATRPDALPVAETWFDSSKHFLGDMFDSTMNYVFRNAVQDHALGGLAAGLVAQLKHLREAYPAPVHRVLMNLLSSHDQARALHVFGWHDDTRDPAVIDRARQRLLLGVFLQMSYPGAPTVYYGDEVGVTGGDDPYNRATYPWPDEGGTPDLALREQFRRLITMRHAHPVLRRGELMAPVVVDEHVVVWPRRLVQAGREQWALVAVNNAATPRGVRLPRPAGCRAGPWPTRWAATVCAPWAGGSSSRCRRASAACCCAEAGCREIGPSGRPLGGGPGCPTTLP